MTHQEHLEAAQGGLMDVEFQHEKMQGLLAFMVQTDETNPPDQKDTKLTLIVLQNLLGEADEYLKNIDHHFTKYMKKEKREDESKED